MNLRGVAKTMWVWLLCLLLGPGSALAQTNGESQLRIRLRDSEGAAVVGEPVLLQRLPEEEPVLPALLQAQGNKCTTDTSGECTWTVRRGLYQVLFARPLDNISALAVAEGGLRGLGVTVGDEDITYHFTFHSDDRVYFDAAPEAAVPFPIMPVGEVLQGGMAPSPVPSPRPEQPVAVTSTRLPDPATPVDTTAHTTSGNSWRVILFMSGGLFTGGGLYLWSRKKQERNPSPISHFQSPVSDPETPGQEKPDA